MSQAKHTLANAADPDATAPTARHIVHPASRAASSSIAPADDSEDARFIIVTFATKGVLDFALNWVLHIRELRLPHMMGAMDDKLVQVCEDWGVPVHAVHRDNPSDANSKEGLTGVLSANMANLRGSDKGFAGLGVLKTLFIQRLLREGRDVLISDTDTAWFKDPRPLVYGHEPLHADFALADLLISTDCIDATDDENPLNSGCWHTPVQKNTGMMFFRSNPRMLTFVHEWEERLVIYTKCPPEAGAKDGKCTGYNDQNLLNEMIEGRPLGSAVWHDGRMNAKHNELRRARCAHAFNGGSYGVPVNESRGHVEGSHRVYQVCMPDKIDRFVVGILPTIHFANGHSFFVQQRFLTTGAWPTAVHVTFTWGDSASYAYGKLQRMKDFGMWKLGTINKYAGPTPPALAAGGAEDEELRRMSDRRYLLVTSEVDVPPPVPYNKEDYDQRSWQHVAWQERVRDKLQRALAIAVVLNRTVILPRFHCYCDRYFYRLEGCMIPGGHHATKLPFVCPFDHIFDTSHWYEQPQHITATGVGQAFRTLGFEGHLYGDELRRAPQISNSRARLHVRDRSSALADDAGAAAAARARPDQPALVVEVASGSTDGELRSAAAKAQHVHIMEVALTDASDMFGAWASKRDSDDFHRLVMHLFGLRVAYCQKECRFEATMYESVRKKQRDPCVWLDGLAKLKAIPDVASAGPRSVARRE